MPYLGDYLGHLISEVTMARMQADVEAVRIAELYASHPLLRTMPVPRFRLPEVQVDIPVVINELEPSNEGGSGTPSIPDLRKSFDAIFAERLKEENIDMPAALRTRLKQALDRTTVALTKLPEVDMSRTASEFTKVTIKTLAETIEPIKLEALEEKLLTTVQSEFLKLRKLPLRLDTRITSAQIKEAGPSEVITHLRLKLVEESFEWTTVETDGEIQNRLVIE
jgi:hypothetical protein